MSGGEEGHAEEGQVKAWSSAKFFYTHLPSPASFSRKVSSTASKMEEKWFPIHLHVQRHNGNFEYVDGFAAA